MYSIRIAIKERSTHGHCRQYAYKIFVKSERVVFEIRERIDSHTLKHEDTQTHTVRHADCNISDPFLGIVVLLCKNV